MAMLTVNLFLCPATTLDKYEKKAKELSDRCHAYKKAFGKLDEIFALEVQFVGDKDCRRK